MKRIAFLAFALPLLSVQAGGTVSVDIGSDLGAVKPLHGVGNGPWARAVWMPAFGRDPEPMRRLAEIGVPFVRLHDTEGRFGGTYFVDVSNIFRDFDRDETDPKNYDFMATDLYISAVVKAGAQVIYRLGESLDAFIVKRRVDPPKDFAKWARICERIIAHYNEGWADGHRWNIRYWEIWNEPANPIKPNPQWSGTPAQFYDLYAVAALHLKSRFPEIKVGGFGIGCLSGTTRWGGDHEVGFVEGFLKHVADRKAPFDFFDMHIYTRDPDEIAGMVAVGRALLDRAGFRQTEIIVGEWNCGAESEDVKSLNSAAMCAASFKVMHDEPVSLACYYVASPEGATYCGLFNYPGSGVAKPYWAFKAYGELAKLGRRVAVVSPRDDLYALAARNGNRVAVLLSRYTVDRHDWKPNFRFDANGFPHPSAEPASEAYLKRVEEADRMVAFNFELKGLPSGKDAVLTVSRLNEADDLTPILRTTIPDGCRSTVMTMRSPEVRLVEVELVPAQYAEQDSSAEAAAGFFKK